MKNKKIDTQILESSLKHQQFYQLQIQHLLSVLDELEQIGDNLVVRIIKNAKERHELDKLIFTKKIFIN